MNTVTPYQADILSLLRERIGEYLTPYAICRAIGRPLAATRVELVSLAEKAIIRRAGTHSGITFYVPTQAQIEMEAATLQSNFKPLKPRLDHKARIDSIRVEREAIPSLHIQAAS